MVVVATPTNPQGNAPLFDITGIEPNATVKLYRNANMVVTMTMTAGGLVQVYDDNNGTPGQNPIPDGIYVYQAQQIDEVGNASTLSEGVTVTTVTTPPLAPSAPVLEAASDTGRLNNDGITSKGVRSLILMEEDARPVSSVVTPARVRRENVAVVAGPA
jgi:hypothetical protein